jgi:pimeloyl-ACP methyl ester carboxylesterase
MKNPEALAWSYIEIPNREGVSEWFELGEFATPEDHDDPRHGEITLRFVILRASAADGRPPLLFLCGGPGESAIEMLRHTPFRDHFRRVATGRDLILLDQRGCGRSDRALPKEYVRHTPYDLVDPDEAYSMLYAQAAGCRAQLKPAFRPSCYTPTQSARDIEILADALRLPKLDIWAHSYGTHLTMAALKLIPDRIGQVTMCGFEGPDQTYKLPSRVTAQLERLAAHFADDWEDMLGDMARVHSRLADSPVETRLPSEVIQVGVFGLQWMVGTWIGLSGRFRRLPALYKSVLNGETAELERAVAGFTKMLDRRPPAFYLNDSASGATKKRLSLIASESSACLLGDAINFPFPRIREAWGQIDLGDTFRAPLECGHTIRILTGALDGFTPTENARESLSTLPNATLEELPGLAHDDLLTAATP